MNCIRAVVPADAPVVGYCDIQAILSALNYGYSCGFDVHDVAPCYLVAFRQRQQLQGELPLMGLVSTFTFLVHT
jgi:hypothetical protein